MKSHFPSKEILLELEPEEIAFPFLSYIKDQMKEKSSKQTHLSHAINTTSKDFLDYAGSTEQKVIEAIYRVLSETWIYLLVQGFLAPSPAENNINWVCLTRRALKVETKEDFIQYNNMRLLPKNILDPKLITAWSNFIRGDFDTAVFAAFKQVEVRIRKACNLNSSFYGRDLIRKAFDPKIGILADNNNPIEGEKESDYFLFMGSIGIFKNPGSHRDVNYDDPIVASSLVLFANTLIKIVEKRKKDISV